jgi:hypothetical protein
MENKYQNKTKLIEKIKSPGLIYLGIIIFIFIIIVILFSFSMGFIVSNVNKIFSPQEETVIQSLDVDKYFMIEKKLNLIKNNIVESPLVLNINNETIINTEIPVQKEELNKQIVTIGIYNTTTTKGAASVLAKELMDVGFSAPFTGNEKEKYERTTVTIKENRKEYLTFIEGIVLKYYPNASFTTIPVDPTKIEFDVTIMIGKQ